MFSYEIFKFFRIVIYKDQLVIIVISISITNANNDSIKL